MSEGGRRLVDQPRVLVEVGQIGGHEGAAAAVRRDRGQGLVGVGRVFEVHDHHVEPGFREGHRAAAPDPLLTAGDQRHRGEPAPAG